MRPPDKLDKNPNARHDWRVPASKVDTLTEPLLSMPQRELFRAGLILPTPALVYDGDGIRATVRRIQSDLTPLGSTRLNLAIKSCRTPAVLALFAQLGVGADVASVAELELATAAGFEEISATGPSFAGPQQFQELEAADVTLDANSIEQLEAWGRWRPGGEVGLRIRMPLPDNMSGDSTFGVDSRFGLVATDLRVAEVVERHTMKVTRLHVHTGQMTPEALVYKTRYLLTVAAAYPHVDLIDLGGGFFHLYAERSRALAAFEEAGRLVDEWQSRHGRSISIRVEPGAALLAFYGQLFVTALSVENDHPGLGTRVITVDASAWNLTPWHYGSVLLADPDIPAELTRSARVAGNTLYENDFFGTNNLGQTTTYTVPDCSAGDRLVITACGAYTITNSRTFHGLPLPTEYLYDRANGVRRLT